LLLLADACAPDRDILWLRVGPFSAEKRTGLGSGDLAQFWGVSSWPQFDHRALHGRDRAVAVARQRPGVAYGTGNLGKFIGPAGRAIITRSSNLVSPQATIAVLVPTMNYFAACSVLGIVAVLFIGFETRGRTIKEIDSLLAAKGRSQRRSWRPAAETLFGDRSGPPGRDSAMRAAEISRLFCFGSECASNAVASLPGPISALSVSTHVTRFTPDELLLPVHYLESVRNVDSRQHAPNGLTIKTGGRATSALQHDGDGAHTDS
jgi:hypothetical protein